MICLSVFLALELYNWQADTPFRIILARLSSRAFNLCEMPFTCGHRVQVLGISVDSPFVHLAWSQTGHLLINLN